MTVFVLKSESDYRDYNDGSTTLHGYTLDEESAKHWAQDMNARAQAAKQASSAIASHMQAWVSKNPRPPYAPVQDLVKPLLKVPKKERTPEQSKAIAEARKEMQRLQEIAVAPLYEWQEKWSAEQERYTLEKFSKQVRIDMAMPHGRQFMYEQVEELA